MNSINEISHCVSYILTAHDLPNRSNNDEKFLCKIIEIKQKYDHKIVMLVKLQIFVSMQSVRNTYSLSP